MFLCCDDMDYWVERDERGPRVCRKPYRARRSALPQDIYPERHEPVREQAYRQVRLPARDHVYYQAPPLRRQPYEQACVPARAVYRDIYPPVRRPSRQCGEPESRSHGHWVTEIELLELGKKAWRKQHERDNGRKSCERQTCWYEPRRQDVVHRSSSRSAERHFPERGRAPGNYAANARPRGRSLHDSRTIILEDARPRYRDITPPPAYTACQTTNPHRATSRGRPYPSFMYEKLPVPEWMRRDDRYW
ncbi:hypothetical protein BO71DRAFT_75190 [Aspergillus ellipticus CBS 707.79]|uniref:Uncharacterized protein n=1 Tax=Aspergillus ellipticus CBS 707.79 TaxID=1448320 RepID=A0A319D0H0_9EURO|nr:hypothetical protein BO71DRAFT_75190 [Aspergillus ellipticus CBS 707.79]